MSRAARPRLHGRNASAALATALVLSLVLFLDPTGARAVVRWEPVGPPGARTLVELGRGGPPQGGANVASVAVDPTDGRRIYAATNDGLFVSDDAGDSWTFAEVEALSPDGVGVGKVLIDPVTPANVYVASCCGLRKSSNGGATFETTSLESRVLDYAIDPTAPSTLHAITAIGLFRSLDAGATWTRMDAAPAGATAIASAGAPALYVATPAGVFASDDGGSGWDPTALTVPASYVATPPGASGTVYAVTADGLEKSTNGGTSWDPLTLPTTAAVVALAFDPDDPGVVYAVLSPSGLLRSPNGGTSWDDVGEGFTPLDPIAAVAVDPTEPSTLYAGTGGRAVAKSTDSGESWTALGVDAANTDVLAVHPLRPGTVFVHNETGFFRTTDGGAHWTGVVVPARVIAMAFDPDDPLLVYAGLGSCFELLFVLRSSNAGRTFEFATAPPVTFGGVTALATDPHTSALYAAIQTGVDDGEVFRSPDGGTTWPFAVTFPPRGLRKLAVSLAVDPSQAGRLYAGTYQGVWTSGDAGDTWATAGEGLEDRLVDALAVGAGSTVYAGTRRVVFNARTRSYAVTESTGVVRRTEGGPWVPASNGLPSLGVNDLVDSAAGAMIWAATDGGVATSRSEGVQWDPAGLPIPGVAVGIDRTDPPAVYVGTVGRGIFRAEIVACTGAADCDDGDGARPTSATPRASSATSTAACATGWASAACRASSVGRATSGVAATSSTPD